MNAAMLPLIARFLIASTICLCAVIAGAQDYDMILRGGRIVDGTGNPSFHADVAVKDGKIAAIGRITGLALRELDVRKLVVAPGFIDVHTHAEEIDELPLAENFLRMGVTTLVLGNCGSSTLNVGEYFAHLERVTVSPNIATLIGHGTVRSRAMRGSFLRPPTETELEEMKRLVGCAMDEGALGLSTGLIYAPGVFAKTDEIIELAKVAAAADGIYATHQRSEAAKIFESLEEIFTIARTAGIRAQISHLKLSGPANWGKAEKVIETIEKARADGLDLTQDQYVYTASSTGLSQLIPDRIKEGGRAKLLERLEEIETKTAIITEMKEKLIERQSPDYGYVTIASHKADPSLNGLTVPEAAKQRRGSDLLDEQIELIFEIERNGGASAVFHGMSDGDLETFARHPNTMFASDSGVRRFQLDVPHPRGYGNQARVLGRYVREKKVLRLEDAIRRMTSLPAQTFRLELRGEVRTGHWADLVVFDPETVIDHATFKDPHHYATGCKYVLVNGVLVIENDAHTGARPGKTVRHPRASVAAIGAAATASP